MGSLAQELDEQGKSTSVPHWQKIPLTQGHEAIVDAADFEWLSRFKWRLFDNHKGQKYAQTTVDNKTVRMHRLILGLTDRWQFCDHRNGEGLDNRRDNLRVATPSQNTTNRKKLRRGGALKTSRGWMVRLHKNGVRHYIGFFKEEEKARSAYIEAARRIHGEWSPV